MSSAATQSYQTPAAIAGCLLDVSGSMREALETGKGDERATERLKAILRAALQLARAEKRQNPDALMFIGAFGLKRKENSVVDLCGLIDALLQGTNDAGDYRNGHDHLIALANEKNVPHITTYIKTKLTEEQARIVHTYLQRHPPKVQEFVHAIPPQKDIEEMKETGQIAKVVIPLIAAGTTLPILGPFGVGAALVGSLFGGTTAVEHVQDRTVENSEAIQLARRICKKWLLDFKDLETQPISKVVSLLERIQDHPSLKKNATGRNLLDDLRPHLYGKTPMTLALSKARAVFREYQTIEQRVLVIITDGKSTDGNPLPLATELKKDKVTIAGVYLTADTTIARRRLYDRSKPPKDSGQYTVFSMASKIAATQHPVPVLVAMGWKIPSSGECALYTTVCSSSALEEFCSLLLSARFGSVDVLLNIVGRVNLDAYINDTHMVTLRNPSDQGESETCYAHATAAVLHMALARIVGREGGCPTIEVIRNRIRDEMPPLPGGRNTFKVMQAAMQWYRPLRLRAVDEDGARQAILGRRPVLATFRLSDDSWDTFSNYFKAPKTRTSILTKATMAQHSWDKDGGGHAVVLVKCDPKSLTFLNSWGHQWGDHGSFSIEDHTVLELRGAPEGACMKFYDVYWYEGDLTAGERKAYAAKVDEEVRAKAAQHPSIFDLEMRCPKCKENAAIARVTGNIREAVCPLCYQSFKPEPGHLVQAIYAKAGLGDVA